MATFRKRGRSWPVQIRRDGFPPITKSFRAKADADGWAREIERHIEGGELSSYGRAEEAVTVGFLLKRYEAEISSRKRGSRYEASRIKTFLRSPLANVVAHRLTPQMVATYRDERLKTVAGETVRRELTVLRHCIEISRKEWSIPIRLNPVRQIILPPPSKVRGDRLPENAVSRLINALDTSRVWYLKPFMLFAIETGMRRGELLSLEWSDIELSKNLAHLWQTRNGSPRSVPLTNKAIDVLAGVEKRDCRISPVKASALRLSW